jgi:hypothetical protein
MPVPAKHRRLIEGESGGRTAACDDFLKHDQEKASQEIQPGDPAKSEATTADVEVTPA